ncbi:MAG: hypothetical protein AABY33_06265 [Pseudomonadota bacterium]
MIKDNTPDLKRFNEIMNRENFDHNLPHGHHRCDNNRRMNGREDNHHGSSHGEKVTLTNEELQMAGMILAKQIEMCNAKTNDSSIVVDACLMNANPMSMKGEALKSLFNSVFAAHKAVKSEEGDDESLMAKVISGCKNLLFGRKHCHDKSSALANQISPAINKDMVGVMNVTLQELGELKTPLMLRGIGIDPGFVVDPDNTKRKKQQQSVMV